jgi:isoleucyl-tRNA synthetase
MYKDVAQGLNFPEMERNVLEFWEKQKIFEKRVQKNRGSRKKFRFIDGPITANNPMGVHHAWGRTLKDVFHRYKAMQGCDARYQNGFDCQGLWVEVEVEKELGFKSKKDIESFGIDNFVEKCKERVHKFSKRQTEQSIRLGYWMDWNNSYFTMAPENNYAIWHFLKKCHEKHWIYKGTDVMPWCHRCGTSLSDMEIATEGYQEKTHRCVYIRLPITGRHHEYLLVWTTTPWTLTSNVAVAVHPELTYLKVKQGEHFYYVVKPRKEILKGEYEVIGEIEGKDLVGLRYKGPFDDLDAQKAVEHRVVAWKEVSDTDGTGMVHIAPGCGKEDHQLGKEEKLPIIAPLDEQGIYTHGFGWLTGKCVTDVTKPIINTLKEKGILYYDHDHTHRYPVCWRCNSELVFRLVDEWFISMDEVRTQIMDVVRTARWIPDFGLERELDWLKNMGDWCISKKRYWGLALPIFECENRDCGTFDLVGGYNELQERCSEGWEKFYGKTPHRPWIDEVKISCPKCAGKMRRVADVGNPWLDAGIVPYSTVIPNEQCYTPDKEISGAWQFDPKRGYPFERPFWQEWFPAEFITECFPGQFRNWFYAILTMSTVLENRTPFETLLGHALVKDEKGEDMHKSKGNAIWFDDAADKLGADLMRWVYCAQNPTTNLNFGFNMASEFRRRLLTLHNVYAFYITYAKLDGYSPAGRSPGGEKLSALDRWVLSELNVLVRDANNHMDNYETSPLVRKIDAFVDALSTWYVRRSRRRFWKSGDDSDKSAAYTTLYTCLETLTRLMAPMMPFWTEDIYQNLVRSGNPKAEESIHLNSFPKADESLIDETLMRQMDLVRDVVSAGHATRKDSKVKVRQPLPAIKFKANTKGDFALLQGYEDIIRDEINVKALEEIQSVEDLIEYRAKPQFAKLGPKFGPRGKAVAAAISGFTSEQARFLKEKGFIRVTVENEEVEIIPEDAEVSVNSKAGIAVRVERDFAVVLDTTLSPELIDEGNARELVHKLQNLRKEAGFDVSDRIAVAYEADAALARAIERHRETVMQEVLASELTATAAPASTEKSESSDINGLKLSLHIRRMR